MANRFGSSFSITTFGESHGVALGAVVDGCPAGLVFDEEFLKKQLARRRPGSSELSAHVAVSPREEPDQPEVLSGVYEGLTLGTPIAVLVRNKDARSEDYQAIAINPRTGHADDIWKNKFGHSDPRGGGRSSGRETLSRVIGGAVAQMFLKKAIPSLRLHAYATEVGPYKLTEPEKQVAAVQDIDNFTARFPSDRHRDLAKDLLKIQKDGDSWGGVAEIRVSGMVAGLGQPVFHKLKADLASALMGVGGTSGYEIGEGTHSGKSGQLFHQGHGPYGGIRGGISTGEDLVMRVHMKPTASILDVAKSGRHDPCILTRAIPVFEAMVAMVLADHVLWARRDRA